MNKKSLLPASFLAIFALIAIALVACAGAPEAPAAGVSPPAPVASDSAAATSPTTATDPAPASPATAPEAGDAADAVLATIRRIDTGSQYGSCCAMMELDGKVVYFDPVDIELREGKVWPKADVIFYTHGHSDHYSTGTAVALSKPGTVVVATGDVAYQLEDAGLERVITAVPPGSEAEGLAEGTIPGAAIRFRTVPMYVEGAGSGHARIMDWCGYVVEADGATLWFSGSSGETPEVKALKGVDIALVAVTNGFTMTVAEAADLMATMKPRYLVPLHYTEDYAGEVAKLPAMMPAGTACAILPLE